MSDDVYICPFCAYKDRLVSFRLKLKRGGYSRKSYKCPDCGQVMRRNTLVRKVTVEEWAEWLYASIRIWNRRGERFYDRISWEKLLKRLKSYGIAGTFWEAWGIAKGYDKERLGEIVDNAYKPDLTQDRLMWYDRK